MDDVHISVPHLALVAGTRVAFGIGVGLLVAERLTCEQRRAAGIALVAVGALTTIPLAAQIFGGRRHRHRLSEDLHPHPRRSLYVPEGIGTE